MTKGTQISAIISDATRERLERYVRQSGVKKGYLIEQALLHHLQALEELPAEYIVRPTLVVSRDTWEQMEAPSQSEPPEALRRLMRDDD
jgi:hypothetical protein